MYEDLKNLLNNSYSNISGYPVACILQMKDGTIFKGVNIENPSFKDGLCAEQVAIGSAIADGYSKGDFDSIHILGNSNHAITPCFLCRQVLVELFDLDTNVVCYDKNGVFTTYTVAQLCPHTFGGEDLDD